MLHLFKQINRKLNSFLFQKNIKQIERKKSFLKKIEICYLHEIQICIDVIDLNGNFSSTYIFPIQKITENEVFEKKDKLIKLFFNLIYSKEPQIFFHQQFIKMSAFLRQTFFRRVKIKVK